LGAVGAPEAARDPALSPDEKQVVFARPSGTSQDLWVRDLSRGTETRFTSDLSQNFAPLWSPKGDRIAFSSNRKDGAFNLYSKAANGGGQGELLLPSSLADFANQWSRDGRFLVFYRIDPKTSRDLWVLLMDDLVSERAADRKPILFLRSEFDEWMGQLSPDSHWMAYTSNRSGRREVYVRPFHFPIATIGASEGEYTISIAGGEMPRWRGDGKELFFVGADGKMMAVSVKFAVGAQPSFEAGTPTTLFEAHMVNAGTTNLFEYDVTADGKRFLIDTTGANGASAPPLTVVTNWQAGVPSRAR
jgi:Tol biopolymer transport system component